MHLRATFRIDDSSADSEDDVACLISACKVKVPQTSLVYQEASVGKLGFRFHRGTVLKVMVVVRRVSKFFGPDHLPAAVQRVEFQAAMKLEVNLGF